MKDQSALDVGIDATARAQGSCTHPDSAEQMTQHIKEAVRRATSGRVHNLDVTVTGTHILLQGFCSTFDCFQLAQHAAMQVVEDLPFDNQIEVL